MSNTNTYIAKTFQGLEELLMDELASLGAQNIQRLKRGCQFEADLPLFYKLNYCSRYALRFLAPIETFRVRNEKGLYNAIREINWGFHFSVDKSFSIDSVVSSDFFNNSHFVALKAKDAIVDQFREFKGSRPNIEKDQPDIKIYLHLHNDLLTVGLDSSGDSLHKRGYRPQQYIAPLSEVLAAGIVGLSKWDKKTPLYDFMCGSGTLLIEGLMAAANVPSQYFRRYFAFHNWSDFDAELWKKTKEEADAQINYNNLPPIYGSDKALRAIRLVEETLDEIRFTDHIKIERQPISRIKEEIEPGTILMNPPYGERLLPDDLFALYKSLGDMFKTYCKGSTAFVISSNLKALKNVGLKPSLKTPLFNGKLECRLYKFELY